MTALNIHAQESESRSSCLSASDPENIPDVRKKIYEILVHYESTEVKQTVAARPEGGRPRSVWVTEVTQNGCGHSHQGTE